jgi:hypothetical protein
MLMEREPVPVPDLETWLEWIQQEKDGARRVGFDELGPAHVSTVFLGIDHRILGRGPPVLFETMVFWTGHALDQECDRYCTWAEAEAGHMRILDRVRQAMDGIA